MPRSLIRATLRTVAAGVTVGVVCSGVAAPGESAARKQEVRTVAAANSPYLLTGVIADDSTSLGVADSDLYGESDSDIDTTLDHLQALGVKDIRIGVPWLYIQPSASGAYDWSKLDYIVNAADQRGMNILGVINGTPSWAGTPIISGQPNDAAFASFAAAVAARYDGKIADYEIWNEPNGVIGMSPVSASAYTALLKAGYTAIKSVDANITVIGGVLGSASNSPGISVDPVTFVQQMYAAGAQGYFDALSYHPYNYTLPFSLGADVANSPLQQVEGIRALMVANGDASLKIWVSEYGLPTNLVSQAQQASYITDFVSAWQSFAGAGPIFIYSARDLATGNWNSEGNFGIFETDWTPKQAADELAVMIRQLNAGTFVPTTIDPSTYKQASAYLTALILTTEVFSLGAVLPTAASQLIQGAVSAVGALVDQAVQGAGQIGYQLAQAVRPYLPAPVFSAVMSVSQAAGQLGVQLQQGLHAMAQQAFTFTQSAANEAVKLTIQATAGGLAAVVQTMTDLNNVVAKPNSATSSKTAQTAQKKTTVATTPVSASAVQVRAHPSQTQTGSTARTAKVGHADHQASSLRGKPARASGDGTGRDHQRHAG
jgi:hypothetical protein